MSVALRLATVDDTERIRDIYAPSVNDSVISFEEEPPSVEDVRHRIDSRKDHYPWLVCTFDGTVVGYAYAAPHRSRAAYRWSVDSSVYVDEAYHRRGVARGLYTALFEILSLQGFCTVYAGTTLPNPASVELHESMGFEPVGVYERVGYKHGAWRDVQWWHRPLGEYPDEPDPPRTVAAVRSRDAWNEALTTGRQEIIP